MKLLNEWHFKTSHIFYSISVQHFLIPLYIVRHADFFLLFLFVYSLFTNVESYLSLVKLKTIVTNSFVCWQLHHYNYCSKKTFVTWFLGKKITPCFSNIKVLSEWIDNLDKMLSALKETQTLKAH